MRVHGNVPSSSIGTDPQGDCERRHDRSICWDYEEKMELMRYFWDAAAELDPEVAKIDGRPRHV